MKIYKNCILLMVLLFIALLGCTHSEKTVTKEVDVLTNLPQKEQSSTEKPIANAIDNKEKSDDKKLHVIATATGTKTYYDKNFNVSLVYPDNWTQELNQYVAFKVNSPQESESDSMKENFFYAVIEENPPTTHVIAKEPKPAFLTIDQMATKMEKEISTESANRKNCKIVSKHKFVLNGVPAYELISTGIIKGIAMKYRIMAMKLGTRQYYLYFSAEENKFDLYQKEADMIFSSFLVK